MSAEIVKHEANVYVQLDTICRDLDSGSAILGGTSLNLPPFGPFACYYWDTACK